MLAPPSPTTRSPGTDLTVLASLTLGLLAWLVVACVGLARVQQQATLHLQREAAALVAAELAEPLATALAAERGALGGGSPAIAAITAAPADSVVARAALTRILAGRPALARFVDSTGLALAVQRAPVTGGTGAGSIMGQALTPSLATVELATAGGPLRLAITRALGASSLALSPVGPQVLLAVLVALLAIAATVGTALLIRLRRDHADARQRSTFASAVSHELRTPLAQILLYAETLQLGRVRDAAARAMAEGVIVQEARRLMRLVDNVLRYARLEQGAPRLRQEPVSLGDVVRETAAQFAPVVASQQVSIAVDAATDALALADADAVRQVVLNLLDNAVKHGPPQQRIVARVDRRAERIRLIVEDEGPGIAAADRAAVWNAFTRGLARPGAGVPRDETGTGLGLMIVRSLTEAMGGDVGCESVTPDGRGARFVVRLPALRSEAA